MHELNFTDINGNLHKINVRYTPNSDVQVPDGFIHYLTVDGPFNIIGKVTYVEIGDIFLNEETGELRTIGPAIIGNLIS